MRILGINGIRTDGATSTDLIIHDLAEAGWDAWDVNYPRVNFFTARSRERQLRNARCLMQAHTPGDVVIAHSYGCLLTLRAMELGAMFSTVFFFSPAMNEDFSFPVLGMDRLYVIHTDIDQAIRLGELLVAHDFGAMGRIGYQGPPDPRISNISTHPVTRDRLSHSHYFLDQNRPGWVQFVTERLRAANTNQLDAEELARHG